MPPKPKFTKEEILEAAFQLVSENGIEALTARELGERLGSSARPIFTVFKDMEEVRSAVVLKAKKCFDDYMEIAENYNPAYKMRGMQWVKFAQEKPLLFRILFMQNTAPARSFDDTLKEIPFGKENDIEIIKRDYNATAQQAEQLFRQMWIYTYGLCVLCAGKVCSFSDDEIARQLGEIFRGMIFVIKSQTAELTGIKPEKKDSLLGEKIREHNPNLSELKVL